MIIAIFIEIQYDESFFLLYSSRTVIGNNNSLVGRYIYINCHLVNFL